MNLISNPNDIPTISHYGFMVVGFVVSVSLVTLPEISYAQRTEPSRQVRVQSHAPLAAVEAAQAGVDEGVRAPGSAALLPVSTSTVAFVSPSGLIASTGNLYWTSYELNEFASDSATVWRAGKDNVPGNERVLYRESGDRSGFYYFGNIVYANPGAFYGYFIANYSDGGFPTSQIKRVSLAGGAAIVLANSPASVGSRDLVTDGATLFWADAQGIRSLPVVGGTVKTLVATSSVARISLDASYLYYAEGSRISRVPKSGGAPTTVLFASNLVTALYVDAPLFEIIWGEQGGAVRSQATSGDVIHVSTYQLSIAGHDITSVGISEDSHLLRAHWTTCMQPGNTYCELRVGWSRASPSPKTVTAAGVGAGHLQWDKSRVGVHERTSVYWGNASTVRRVNLPSIIDLQGARDANDGHTSGLERPDQAH
jgi:hypothetical protein